MLDLGTVVNFIINTGNHVEPIFFEIGIIIILSTLFGFTLKVFKQPLIPAYVLAGVFLGPYGLNLINNYGVIETLSEMGVAFLLFVVGMEMDFKRLKTIGLIATVGGTIQIMILSFSGWIIGLLLGLSTIEALYCGLIVAFSSTMLVIKLLKDQNELDTLHGRIIIGFLLMEDIFAIVAILVISNYSRVINSGIPTVIGLLFLKILLILVFTFVAAKYIFPPLFKLAAESQEVLFLLSITTCFFFAFFSTIIGLSVAIGAFLAGLAIANLPYRYDIISKINALLIFFTTIFFTALGLKLRIVSFSRLILPLLVFVLFISLCKPFITSLICSFFGYKRRTSLISSMTLAQTSEFSLIIVSLGISSSINHLGPDSIIPSLAVLLSIITMVITSYSIKFSEPLYNRIKTPFKFLDKIGSGSRELDMVQLEDKYDVVLIGHDRIGYNILRTLHNQHKKVVVVDYNPEVVRKLIDEGVDCIYGDISDPEMLERLKLKKAGMIISTVNDYSDNLSLLNHVKKINSKAVVFVTALKVDEALDLYEDGADYVILPNFLGGHHVSIMLEEEASDLNKLLKKKLDHIKELEHRKHVGHEHPRNSK